MQKRHLLITVLFVLISILFFGFPKKSAAFSISIPTISLPPIPTLAPLQIPQTVQQDNTIKNSFNTNTSTFQMPQQYRFPTPVIPTQAPLVTQTPKPTVTPFPTLKPLINPTSTYVIPSPTQTQVSSDVKTYIMNAINNYRRSLGLSAVQTSTETCNFAKTRAKEISTNFSHDGFQSRINNHTIPYSTWSLITENIAMTPDYKNVATMWINSPGHAANMQKNTPYVCVEQYGNYYAYEGMKP